MLTDRRGLTLGTSSPEALAGFERMEDDYFDYRLSTGKRLKAVLEADPDFAMAHCMQGYLFMLFGSTGFYPRVEQALAAAREREDSATPRERIHIEALDAWLAGNLEQACRHWDDILTEHPHDLLCLRLQHFNAFWMGDAARMRSAVAGVFDAWDESIPGYGNVLGMLGFALEESGEYARAEALGRRAVEINPDDLWAVHAVAHVLEMQGRLEEGSKWLDYPADAWDDRNPFRGHLWWHAALFLHESGDYRAALDLYDRSIANVKSEFYLDIQNMAALLYRLEFQGVDVGDRWGELADHAETRVDDHVLAFTDVHCMMALGADGRDAAMDALVASLEAYGERTDDYAAATMAGSTVPLCRAIAAYHRERYDDAVEILMAIRHRLAPIGGSHAQRDVFWQLLLESAIRAGRLALARTLLSERVTLRPHSHGNWRKYVSVLEASGADASGVRQRAAEQGFADVA